jgi:GTP-binding protein
VGKSSLVNSLLGTQRLIVHPEPGTTRDPVDTRLDWRGRSYILIDTAGIRKKGRTRLALEKYCVIKAIQSIGRCDVALLVLDALEGPTEQDSHIAGYAYEMGKGLIVVVNKWDLMERKKRVKDEYIERIRMKMKFLDFVPVNFVSALTGESVMNVLEMVDRVAQEREKRIDTGILNRHFQRWVERFQPPLFKTKTVKFYYITQASIKPPTFIIFTNYPDGIHFSYNRYLINRIREDFGFDGTPLKLIFKKDERT